MIRINLLPFRAARKKENIKRQITIFFLLIILVVAGLFYGNGFFAKKIDLLNGEIAQINRELASKTKAAKEVDQIKKELDELKQKTEVINSLATNRRAPVELMDAMTQLVVKKRMWFTSFSAVANTISIKGIALDNQTIADFMTRLEESSLFSSVNLDSSKKETYKQTFNLKSFAITCQKTPKNAEAGKKVTI